MAGSNLFPELFAGLLGDAVERFLRLDPDSRLKLAPLSGKVFEFRFIPLDWRFCLCPDESTIRIIPGLAIEPDVRFVGSPLDFIRIGLSGNPRSALFGGGMAVEGDMQAARAFQRLFEQLQLDWAALLKPWLGSNLANSIVGNLQSSHAWRVDSVNALKTDVIEYLQEESQELPTVVEADWFYSDVDGLRADCDRLEARIVRLTDRTAG